MTARRVSQPKWSVRVVDKDLDQAVGITEVLLILAE